LADACDPDAGNYCCGSFVCVTSKVADPDIVGCRAPCKANVDCDTNCCRKFGDSNDGFCAVSALCECLKEGAACGSGSYQHCCDGLICAGDVSPDKYSCRPSCKNSQQCADGGYCLFFASQDAGVCAY
jgi:hypothetical protein